jgi:AcrR family transcriptional regulator
MSGTLRKRPQQARSRHTVERIVDAATRVFIEMGYSAATTNHIAAQAEVSVGSLYQFFPHKAALLEAVQGRWLKRLRTALDNVFDQAVADRSFSLEAIIDGALSVHQQVGTQEPGLLKMLWTTSVTDFDMTHTQQIRLVARMCMHITDALYPSDAPPLDPARLAEVRAVLLAYLRPLLTTEET